VDLVDRRDPAMRIDYFEELLDVGTKGDCDASSAP
jgi:hypothetical protein